MMHLAPAPRPALRGALRLALAATTLALPFVVRPAAAQTAAQLQALQVQQAAQAQAQAAQSQNLQGQGQGNGALGTNGQRTSLPDLLAPGRQNTREGEATESEGGAAAVGPLGDNQRQSGPATAIFGASLFTREAVTTSDAPNPNYILSPGDRVSVRVWGAVEAETSNVIDPQGNLFLPQIGPIRLAGTRAGDLQRIVEAEVRRIYTQQVQVYSTVLSTHRIGVFVTGFVRTPGRFGGAASDTILDFLVRSGGVDPGRGSFRDIKVERGGRVVTNVDLYQFLLAGRLPQVALQEGDTIVVGRQRNVIGADGAVRNNYLFENAGRVMTGRELIEYAAPLPAATNAVIRGSRNGAPFSRYATVRELAGLTLGDQDVVTFITDAPAQTVRVTVEGSRIGPSVIVTDRNNSLCQVLDYIAVDPSLADTRSVFLLRPRLAQQQQRVINEALDRLERQLFTALSPTTGVAQIRGVEATLVSTYIQRGRRTRPEGRLVVTDRNGRCAQVRLEDGDVIVIPERSDTVLVSGEVVAPQAVLYRPDLTLQDYVRQAGGFSQRGQASTVMLRRANGEVYLDPGNTGSVGTAVGPGDELIVLPVLDPKNFQIASDVLSLLYQVAFSARVVTN